MISIGGGTKETTILRNGPDPAFDYFERAILGNNWAIFNGNVGIINNSDLGIVSHHWKDGDGRILIEV